LLTLPLLTSAALAADGNRLTYLDGSDPYHVSRRSPRLVTPQWVGEEGVEAVVILAIDDMRDPAKYEAFLRPILQRLKRIDGRAPVSIMTNQIDPKDARLQGWLKEGLSLETHTIDHPCPLLQRGEFARARSTYERCVDLMGDVPGSRPVAFRVPCCDSLNTPSPRFFAEIFNKKTAKGNFLTIDSSVLNIFTSNDPELPRELVVDADGQDRFLKYVPADRTFVNTIENYPYPYVIGRLCWQFPCVMPSDWVAQHRQQPANPLTLADWKAALDATVIKQGVFCLIFHPYGWSRNEQIVDLIEHAVTKHGKKVKFLNFREAQERLDKHLLGGQTLRAADGRDNGVRLLDLDNDGYMDVVIGNEKARQTRRWSPKDRTWNTSDFPMSLVDAQVHFGIVDADGSTAMLVRNEATAGAWRFRNGAWSKDGSLLAGLELEGSKIVTGEKGRDRGVRLRDLNGDGRCELIVSNDKQQAIFRWSDQEHRWNKLPFALPEGVSIVNAEGKDNGLRFVDIDEDGFDDVLFSNEERYSLHLFTSMKEGWSRQVKSGTRGDKGEIPAITHKGSNNGAWLHSRHLWVQSENTDRLKDHVERRSFNELLEGVSPTAKTPEASLRSIRTHPGFQVELVAAEPLVQSPIAFAWGPDGKLWVVEMGDYPLGLDNKGKPGGRIKYLEDTDGDGRYDKATVFLDGLSFPTNVLPWRKGVLVTCAPDILYAEDTTGSGKADRRVALFTGFVPGNPQHRVNGLVWGLDNWIYCANGDSGGRVKSVKTGAEIDLRGRDLRIRPDDGALDAQSGQTQYGRNRDDWGDWFGCNNSNPMWQFVLEDHYIRRNPHLAAPDPRVPVSVTPGASAVYPISRTLPRFNDPHAANHFTSACSAIVYRDELFGPAFRNSTFVSEPVHNLIHREVLSASGVTFTSRRAVDEQKSEFLASSDNWFRPTSIQTGPDGALWVADMYRAVIEHPEWIPPDRQKRLDLRAGQDKGRIYRVFPVGIKPRQIPRLDRLDTAGLVAALDSPNCWQRDTVQQMLIWRKDAAAVPLLEKLSTDCQRPLGRLHALCTLDGLDALTPAVLQKALADKHPGVRRHAVRLCERRLSKAPELGDALVKLVDDADAHVRMQLAYTLGEWADLRAGDALGRLALRDAGDRYLTAAVMSSLRRENLDRVLLAVLKGDEKTPPPGTLIESLLRMANALGDRKALVTLLTAVSVPANGRYAPWQFAALTGLLDALDERNKPLTSLRGQGDEWDAALKQITGVFDAARKVAADERAASADRLRAIRLLGRGLDRQKEDMALLAGLLVPQTADDVQAAAIAALGRLRSPRVPEALLRGWKSYGPTQRDRVLGVLLSRDEWLRLTLDAIERHDIAPSEINAIGRQRLLAHRSADVRRRAAKLFADTVNADRQKVLDSYQSVLSLTGDAKHGAELFRKHCAACHQLGGVGNAVGPDLASLGDKSPQALLVAILDPNRAVEARYVGYTATTKSGRVVSGVLAAETGNSITLVGTDGQKTVILRTDLDELTSTGKSAMPEGLEKEIKPQDMADLIAHVRGASPQLQRKTFEGNNPETLRPLRDGSLLLSASNCEIYGPTIVLEKQYGNLGYWTSEEDHAVWSIEVERAGTYTVWLDYACEKGAAGKAFLLQSGSNRLTGEVASTGDWDTYRRSKVGEITLTAGKQRITFRSAGKISGPLIDLRSIKLVPQKRE
jgi:putative membrane-bound dehydrogenase-like protein